MLVIDQHALHERILFEQLLATLVGVRHKLARIFVERLRTLG